MPQNPKSQAVDLYNYNIILRVFLLVIVAHLDISKGGCTPGVFMSKLKGVVFTEILWGRNIKGTLLISCQISLQCVQFPAGIKCCIIK